MTIKTYHQAIKYLESFIGKVFFKLDPQFLKQHDPLERMRVLLSLLGNPQNKSSTFSSRSINSREEKNDANPRGKPRGFEKVLDKFKAVLIGGTSGKGSTAYLISHILRTAGYKTGLTISPHLQRINERIQINDKPISDKAFVELTTSMIRIIEVMKKMKVGAPSYFEILIAMAFLFFAREKVDIAVVEVGMGGEYDATNTLYPLIAVLTNVGLDHTNILGNTVEKIAKTKAGIIKGDKRKATSNKNDLIVVTGVKQKSVAKIVEDKCKKVGAELLRFGKDFDYKVKKENTAGSVFDLITTSGRGVQLNNLKLSLIGKYQVENASLAIETVLQLRKFGFKISEQSIKKALQTAFFPGRFEIIKKSPNNPITQHPNIQIVLDGAHNQAKMQAFLGSLKKIFPKTRKIFIVAFKEDKNIKAMMNNILKVADTVIVTQFRAKTDMKKNASADALKIKNQISSLRQGFGRQAKLKKVIIEKDSKRALQKALNYPIAQLPNCPMIIVVTGSLYLVGEIRSML